MRTTAIPEEKLREVIGQAAGEASLCWEPKPTGIFDASYASGIVDRTVNEVLRVFDEESNARKGTWKKQS